MKIGSLFSGYGGLDLAVVAELGGTIAWHCENDPAASRVLAHHWPDVPNLMDITAVDWSAVEPIDVLTGGFPCQDVSSSGRRAGLRPGTRSALWSHMAHAINELRPSLVVIENVRGLLSAQADCDLEPCPWCLGDGRGSSLRALGAVLGDLAVLRYDAFWCGLQAADVGAPHGRFRVFVLAWDATSAGPHGRTGQWVQHQEPRSGYLPVADAGHWPEPERARPAGWGNGQRAPERERPGNERPAVAHAESEQQRESAIARSLRAEPRDGDPGRPCWGNYTPAIRRWEHILGRPAPAATQPGRRTGQQLSPSFVEWLMGLDEGHVTGVPDLSRNDQLRVLGNGVVPQQARAALQRFQIQK